MQLPRLSPEGYRRVTLFAALALAFIVVSGGAVRLTQSGLGCPSWPNCEPGSLAPRDATSYHAMVEFVNRTITGVVSLAVILAVLGSLVRVPRRHDLTWLALGLVGGVVGQIVLGGLTVIFDLAPPFVIGHFLLSMVLLWNAVVLHHRAAQPDGARRPRLDVDNRTLVRLVLAAATVVVVTGTIVTGSGPHGGDVQAERLPFLVRDVARVHAGSVLLLLGLLGFTLRRLRVTGAPAATQRAGRVLLTVLLMQAAVGYAQYFTGVPAVLVGLHLAGAAAVWSAAVRLVLTTSEPTGVTVPALA